MIKILIWLFIISSITMASTTNQLEIISNEANATENYNLAIKYYEEGNYSMSSQLNIKACEKKHFYACRAAGNFYKSDKWIKQNTDKYMYLYEKACEYGDKKACFELAQEYNNMNNISKAILFYTKACNGNIYKSCTILGSLYYLGKGVNQDYNIAKKFFSKACHGNHMQACSALAEAYMGTDTQYYSPNKAIKLYKKACENNEIKACYNLAIIFHEGKAIKKNYEKAKFFYEIACANKYILAYRNLANLYLKGDGTKQNIIRAKGLYKHACTEGDKESCRMLKKIRVIEMQSPNTLK